MRTKCFFTYFTCQLEYTTYFVIKSDLDKIKLNWSFEFRTEQIFAAAADTKENTTSLKIMHRLVF